jgi:hypothetical protein
MTDAVEEAQTVQAEGSPFRELSFGQAAVTEPSPHRNKLLAGVGLAAVLAAGYVFYAWSAGTPQAALPTAPPGPTSLSKPPLTALPVLSDEQIDAIFGPVLVPRSPLAPASGDSPAAPSDQAPNNSN